MTKLWHCNQIIVVLAINTTLRQRVLPHGAPPPHAALHSTDKKIPKGWFSRQHFYHAKQLPVWKLCHA